MPPTLFTLPQELREMIYERLFSSIIISHGLGKKSSNRTAVLQTCRQIRDEAHPFLTPNVKFHFRGTEAMLDTLMSLDPALIGKIRHIRVKAFPFPLYANGNPGYYTTYHFGNALALLPGLQLDRLVVEDCFHDSGIHSGFGNTGTYFDIETLLESDGWKELHYISPTTEFMTSPNDLRRSYRQVRVAQPAGWTELLQKRDGEDSGAAVTMYVANEAAKTGITEDPALCSPWTAIPGHKLDEGAQIAKEREMEREVRVIARRGRKVNYSQDGSKVDEKIRKLFESHSWSEVKNEGLYLPDWLPYYYDSVDRAGWIYGGWSQRFQLALAALR